MTINALPFVSLETSESTQGSKTAPTSPSDLEDFQRQYDAGAEANGSSEEPLAPGTGKDDTAANSDLQDIKSDLAQQNSDAATSSADGITAEIGSSLQSPEAVKAGDATVPAPTPIASTSVTAATLSESTVKASSAGPLGISATQATTGLVAGNKVTTTTSPGVSASLTPGAQAVSAETESVETKTGPATGQSSAEGSVSSKTPPAQTPVASGTLPDTAKASDVIATRAAESGASTASPPGLTDKTKDQTGQEIKQSLSPTERTATESSAKGPVERAASTTLKSESEAKASLAKASQSEANPVKTTVQGTTTDTFTLADDSPVTVRTTEATQTATMARSQPVSANPYQQVVSDPVQQIANAIRVHRTDQSITVRLDPPELGSVTVDLTIDKTTRHVTAIVSAEQTDTSSLLRRQLDVLQRELNNAGFDDVSVELGQHSTQDNTSSEQWTSWNQDIAAQQSLAFTQGSISQDTVNIISTDRIDARF